MSSSIAWGYPIDNFDGIGLDEANNLSRSINETVMDIAPLNLFKSLGSGFVGTGDGSSSFNFINFDSFSKGDIPGALKAIAVLFLQITITAIGVTLGILKALLGLLMAK
ncbi:MAG: hypothetical protein Q7S32_04900 [bacterium]|nr:hypothetical protein [bacterium]